MGAAGDAGFYSKLHQLLATGSQGQAPPKQWAAMIKARYASWRHPDGVYKELLLRADCAPRAGDVRNAGTRGRQRGEQITNRVRTDRSTGNNRPNTGL